MDQNFFVPQHSTDLLIWIKYHAMIPKMYSKFSQVPLQTAKMSDTSVKQKCQIPGYLLSLAGFWPWAIIAQAKAR